MIVPIKSEPLFGPGIFNITGNSFLGVQHAHLDESPGLGGLTPPTGNLGATHNNLIMTDQAIQFKFEWGVTGSFVHMVNPAFEWRIQLYFEEYGIGEFNIGANGFRAVPWSSGTPVGLSQVNFPGTPLSTYINIPGGIVPAGLYDVVAVIQLYDMPSGLPCFASAFAEFNKINFYKEH